MNIDLDELERIALAASPGPWAWEEDCLRSSDSCIVDTESFFLPPFYRNDDGLTDPEAVPDAKYLATFNPATVLKLIAQARNGVAA